MSTVTFNRDYIIYLIKNTIIAELKLSISPDSITDEESLDGDLLKVNSFCFVKIMIRLEEELGVTLPDDLFVGRPPTTVTDLLATVLNRSGIVQ